VVHSLSELGRFAEAALHEAELLGLAAPTQHAYTVGEAYAAAGTLLDDDVSQRHRTRVAVTCCLTLSNVPSTVARPALHRALPNENTWTASVPSLKSKV
jgi:hypothetical protein